MPLRLCHRLPIETIEQVIDEFSGDATTLSSFSLTCRTLRTRSRRNLFAYVRIQSIAQLQQIPVFLDARPWLPPLVQRIAISPPPGSSMEGFGVIPSHLITRFPNLCHWRFMGQELSSGTRNLVLNPSTLRGFRDYGIHIHYLTLESVDFSTLGHLMRLLLSFASLQALYCTSVRTYDIHSVENATQRSWAEQFHLRHLSLGGHDDKHTAAHLLKVSQSNLEHLEVKMSLDGGDHFGGCTETMRVLAPRLRSLSFHLYILGEAIWAHKDARAKSLSMLKEAIEILQQTRIRSADLRDAQEVTITLASRSAFDLYSALAFYITQEVYHDLETALLDSSSARRTLVLETATIKSCRQEMWVSRIIALFPRLRSKGRLEVKRSQTPHQYSLSGTGHDRRITVLVASPDGKWFASGSEDSTIIVWGAQNHTIAWDWIAHDQRVNGLAFSPDSRYILSVGNDTTPKVWDLHNDAALIATLEGHKKAVRSCAWAGTGPSLLATGSDDGTVRIWNSLPGSDGSSFTFPQLHLLVDTQHKLAASVTKVQLSSDASWVLATREGCPYLCMWNISVESEPPLKTLPRRGRSSARSYSAPRHDPGFEAADRRIVAVSDNNLVCVWQWGADREVEEFALIAKRDVPTEITQIAVSPDGGHILIRQNSQWHGEDVFWWDLENNECTTLRQTHGCRSVAFSPDGKYFATGDMRNEIRLWTTSRGSCITLLPQGGSGFNLAFSSDGRKLASSSGFGVYIYDLNSRVLL